MNANSPSAPNKVTAAQRREKALEARKAGYTYKAIGESLGITEQGAYKSVMRALSIINKNIAETAEEVRTIELERIDNLFKVMYKQALKGNQGAVDRCIRLMDRRARYLGLDAVERKEMTGQLDINVRYVDADN